jgi:hypothetical protein
MYAVEQHECGGIARHAHDVARRRQGFDIQDGVAGRDYHDVGAPGGVKGAVVAAAGCIDNDDVGLGGLRSIEGLAEAGGLGRDHGGRFGSAPVFPVARGRLGVEIDDSDCFAGARCGNGEPKGHGRFSRASFLPDD